MPLSWFLLVQSPPTPLQYLSIIVKFEKAFGSICVFFGTIAFFKFLQNENVDIAIYSTFFGIIMLARLKHP